MNYDQMLEIPINTDMSDVVTVKDYLWKLLSTMWFEQEGFSGKRPFGDSGWDFDIYQALIAGGAIEGTLDEDGCIDNIESGAWSIVDSLINHVFGKEK